MPRNRIPDQRKAACGQKYIKTESIVATQRWYRTTYGRTARGETSNNRWHRRFSQNGAVADLPRAGRLPEEGGHIEQLTF